MEEHAVYRVLMVEDDRGIAQAVQTQGQLWNLEVRQVQDLRHVMEEFAAFDPHLVLLDIGLPCFDGYHWCTEIRRVSRVPVIFISSAADNMNIIMAMNLGADDFIAKPFDQSVLMAKIQALLRRTYDFGVSGPRGGGRGAAGAPHRPGRSTTRRGRCAETPTFWSWRISRRLSAARSSGRESARFSSRTSSRTGPMSSQRRTIRQKPRRNSGTA